MQHAVKLLPKIYVGVPVPATLSWNAFHPSLLNTDHSSKSTIRRFKFYQKPTNAFFIIRKCYYHHRKNTTQHGTTHTHASNARQTRSNTLWFILLLIPVYRIPWKTNALKFAGRMKSVAQGGCLLKRERGRNGVWMQGRVHGICIWLFRCGECEIIDEVRGDGIF